MKTAMLEAARNLGEWSDELLASIEAVRVAIARDDRLRRVALEDDLVVQSRKLARDPGKGESTFLIACRILGTACLTLGFRPLPAHWQAALEVVEALRESLAAAVPASIDFGTPGTLFRQHFLLALENAGYAEIPSFLDDHDRKIALGQAVNWGLRFVIAHALEAKAGKRPLVGGALEVFRRQVLSKS